jgi:hypothetical protein
MPGTKHSAPPAGVTFQQVCAMALALPEVTQSVTHGTPSLRVKERFFSRLLEDGETLSLKCDQDLRDVLIEARSEVFCITEHYRNYAYVLVRLPKADLAELRDLVERAWRMTAPKRLVAARDRA